MLRLCHILFFRNYYLALIFLCSYSYSDSFDYNLYNNHGVVGLINTPSARFFNEGAHGFTVYAGKPDTKVTMTASPFDWMEASLFYGSVDGKRYCPQTYDPICSQDYKDKGFNFKFRIKEEGIWPAIALGFNDISGTGLYSSEYVVASYGINNTDFHFGLGWGKMSSRYTIKNPLGYLHDSFFYRPVENVAYNQTNKGGRFSPKSYFSGETASPFFGVSHVINNKLRFKFEYDPTNTDCPINTNCIEFENASSDFSFGFDYKINKNFTFGLFNERGTHTSARIVYKLNPRSYNSKSNIKKGQYDENDNKYTKFIQNLESNDIGVNKIIESSESIGVELTTFMHPNLNKIEEIISFASMDAGINKDIKKDLRIADLQAVSEYDKRYENNAALIYQRQPQQNFSMNNSIVFRPFLAAREGFFKGAIMLENDNEYVIKDNFFFSSNLKYSIWDNFSDLYVPPRDVGPNQVRTDVKDYLKGFENKVVIGRAQFDYHLTPKKNHHIMATAGIFEEMFQGFGGEYLYYDPNTNYAIGFEVFKVKKRDYEMRFGTLDYENIVSSINYYHRNYGSIPFDMKISAGEYLAGDLGATIEFSRTYKNGIKFGVFATFTDVSFSDYGEGSFDKGIFFNIPIYGNLINYTWKPLTKDPGTKLSRKHTIYDLLVRFKPIN